MHLFDSKLDLFVAAADAFCDAANQAIRDRGVFRVSLSGGSTPRGLYELLAERDLPWDQVQWFWGDERNVSAEHDESNQRMVRQALLDHLPAEKVHAFAVPTGAGQGDTETTAVVANQYETKLKTVFEGQSWPTWDLVLLGLGDDAHTASLFPGTEALTNSDRWFVANWVPKFDAFRFTLTAAAINSGRRKLFLVSGENKRDALERAHSKQPSDPNAYPSQLIEDAEFFVTTDAVA
ncbi:MAG: 6-phosphogluconolactonase [Planctomycetota bacterium]